MNPWLETICVVALAVTGVFIGRLFSRLNNRYWLLGYLLPAALVVALIIARYAGPLAFVRPFYWITAGRLRFVVLSLVATVGLSTPLSRLHRRSERVAVCIVMTIVVVWFAILPFLVPALIADRLAALPGRIDADGVCFQSTDFTCAPAAAVTALRRLGFDATEGEIAVLSRSSPVVGTLPGCLQTALQQRYGPAGLRCRYRYFDSLDQLEDAGLTLAVVRDSFLVDHCVAVLAVSDKLVTVADPVMGKVRIPRERFEKLWRYTGVVLTRDAKHHI